MGNPVGHRSELTPGGHNNSLFEGDRVSGIEFQATKFGDNTPAYGEATLCTIGEGTISRTETWERSRWPHDRLRSFWDDINNGGGLTPNSIPCPSDDGETDVGSVALSTTLAPEETRRVPFLITWYFPIRPAGWNQTITETESVSDCGCEGNAELTDSFVKNQYATRFEGACDVAKNVARRFDHLRDLTFSFRDAFFDSTVPAPVLDAASSQIAIARSNTCMWLEDGSFLAWEGDHCCNGTCTHVWNYAWTLAALFPSLEREMRRIDFEESVDSDGYMSYRTPFPFGSCPLREYGDAHPAIDGQMGTILRLYREWTYSGDDAFLRRLWPEAKRCLEFAFEYEEWDPDENGVLEGSQHNTYDVEFFGPNPLSQSWYLAALKAGAEMARAMDEPEVADRYLSVYESGRQRTDDRLWNGSYYRQDIDDVDAHRYQHENGCLSDQLLGQWYADQLDLGDILPADHVETALDSIVNNNFKKDLSDHENCQRTFALNDEAGLTLCSWPNDGRPEYPFVYSDEVWPGIEYQVASHLFARGRVSDGLELVDAVRDRHDGRNRNPWNEYECGNHYVRSMASWAVYESIIGAKIDLREDAHGVNEYGFSLSPAIERDPFECFWITGEEWGTYERDGNTDDITQIYSRNEYPDLTDK
jgi:uncharacterized protein (DUF608 family)